MASSPGGGAHAGQERIAPLAADISVPAAGERPVAAARGRWGRLDILVNNAGDSLNALAEATTLDQWDHVLAVNLRGTFLLCRAAIPALREASTGRIVNIASVMAERTDYGLGTCTGCN